MIVFSVTEIVKFICVFPEQRKKESDDIDHDAIAHRLKQDVVSIKTLSFYDYALDFYEVVISYEVVGAL